MGLPIVNIPPQQNKREYCSDRLKFLRVFSEAFFYLGIVFIPRPNSSMVMWRGFLCRPIVPIASMFKRGGKKQNKLMTRQLWNDRVRWRSRVLMIYLLWYHGNPNRILFSSSQSRLEEPMIDQLKWKGVEDTLDFGVNGIGWPKSVQQKSGLAMRYFQKILDVLLFDTSWRLDFFSPSFFIVRWACSIISLVGMARKNSCLAPCSVHNSITTNTEINSWRLKLTDVNRN